MNTKEINKIARYLKVPVTAILEVLIIQFSNNLDKIIDLSRKTEIGTNRDFKIMARWNELFFYGIKYANNITEIEYFRNKWPPDNKPYAVQAFSEKLKYLEVIASLSDDPTVADPSNNSDKISTSKKTNNLVETIIAGIQPAEYKVMYEDTQDEAEKLRILKAWKLSYHINIKHSETIEQIKETLENSPYKYSEHEKFVKFSKKAIKKWASLTKTPSQAVDLDIYCYEKNDIYSIDEETERFIFNHMYKVISTSVQECDNKSTLRETFNITEAPDVKAEVIKKVCDIKGITYGQVQDS